MTVISFSFFALVAVGLALYYAVPKRAQWVILLFLSLAFYHFAAEDYSVLFLVASTVVSWAATWVMDHERKAGHVKASRAVLGATIAAVVVNVALWFLLKGSSFWVVASEAAHRLWTFLPEIPAMPVIAALGMGYYTAQMIAYLLDCYWATIEPQRNPIKLFLFCCYFPQLTVGPISRYSDLGSLFEHHEFDGLTFRAGLLRILWGLFEKLVISDRLAVFVGAIWVDPVALDSLWPWVAVLLYPLQLYTDFSGCMEIILGVSALFGIPLAENFRTPFASRTVQEFWQRWHITLGSWARDYVYYPVLKSRFVQGVRKRLRGKVSKRVTKLVPWLIAMAVLWFVMGFWHGSLRHILGVSLWYFTVLAIGELLSPLFTRARERLRIPADALSWRLVQMARTYLIFAFGSIAFSAATFTDALGRYQSVFRAFQSATNGFLGPGYGLEFGLDEADLVLLAIATGVLVVVEYLRERHGQVQMWVLERPLPIRWALVIGLMLAVIVFGRYGPSYNANAFIYAQF